MLVEPSRCFHIQASTKCAHDEQVDGGDTVQRTYEGVTHEVWPMHEVLNDCENLGTGGVCDRSVAFGTRVDCSVIHQFVETC